MTNIILFSSLFENCPVFTVQWASFRGLGHPKNIVKEASMIKACVSAAHSSVRILEEIEKMKKVSEVHCPSSVSSFLRSQQYLPNLFLSRCSIAFPFFKGRKARFALLSSALQTSPMFPTLFHSCAARIIVLSPQSHPAAPTRHSRAHRAKGVENDCRIS